MEEKNNPLSPHLQIYKWQISSLLSIAHRIVGVINILAITVICFWSLSLLLGAESYLIIKSFFCSYNTTLLLHQLSSNSYYDKGCTHMTKVALYARISCDPIKMGQETEWTLFFSAR